MSRRAQHGFTLIEVLVVLSIIVIISVGILTAVYRARTESRDLARIADVQQFKLAVKLYKEAKNDYPKSATALGVVLGNNTLGIGGAIDTALAPFLSDIHNDPRWSSAASNKYFYRYNNNFTCSDIAQIVVFALTTENPTRNANFEEVCTAATAASITTHKNAYIEIVKP